MTCLGADQDPASAKMCWASGHPDAQPFGYVEVDSPGSNRSRRHLDSGGGRYRLVSHGKRKRNHSANPGSKQSVLGSSHRGEDEKDASDGRAVPMPGCIILMLMKTNADKPRKLNARGCALLFPAFTGERSVVTMDANIKRTGTEGKERARHEQHTRTADFVMTDYRLLINGSLVEGAGTLEVINPATGGILTDAPRADRAQLDQAVAAAKAAFPTWSATPLRKRGVLLVKLAEALAAEQDEFARLLTEEQGKPLPQAIDEIAHSIATIRYFATLDLPLEVVKEDSKQKVIRQRKAARRCRGDHAVDPADALADDQGRAGPPRR